MNKRLPRATLSMTVAVEMSSGGSSSLAVPPSFSSSSPCAAETELNDSTVTSSRPTSIIKRFRTVREMKQSTPSVSFVQPDDSYKCCCGAVHVKQGALIIGYFSAVMCILNLMSLMIWPAGQYSTIISAFSCLLQILCCVALIIGIRRQKPALLLPFAGMMVLSVTVSVIGAVIFGAGLFLPSSPAASYVQSILEADQEDAVRRPNNSYELGNMLVKIVSLFLCIILLFAAALSIWWLRVTLACRRYLMDAKISAEITAKYARGGTNNNYEEEKDEKNSSTLQDGSSNTTDQTSASPA